MPIRIGTRSSNLAMWQARSVASALNEAGVATEIIQFKSMGDRSLGGNLSATVGQFIHLIDEQLISGQVDIAVHSSKDVPIDSSDSIRSLAYMKRGATADLISAEIESTGLTGGLMDINDWIDQTLAVKGYIQAQEDREDFILRTGAGATKFNKWMKKAGLFFNKQTGRWTRNKPGR